MPSGVTLAELGIEPPVAHPRRPAPDGARPGPGATTFGFEPGLEGLRGLAVVVVLLFHGGFTWAVGGYLGVSTFFTLSGFLITTLLLAEHQRSGRVALRRFWARRFRRLMPASLLCLAGVVVFGATVATPAQLVSLRGDIVAALLYVANWHFIATGQSYAELFAAPSPVLHFWSLAIEEQFYLVFPLLVAGILALRRGARAIGPVLAVGAVASVAWMAHLATTDVDAAYYSTLARAAELLIGALLAVVLRRPRVLDAVRSPRARPALVAAGGVALAASVWAWHAVAQTDEWLYRGGFAAYALASAVLVVVAMHTRPWRAVFSVRPLRWIGAISYGVYLFHWPIFLWLTPLRTGLSIWPLFGLRIVVTLAAALVSYHLVEQPIRTKRLLTGWRPFVVAPVVVSLVAVATVRVTADPPTGDLISFDAATQPEVPDYVSSEAVDVSVPTTAPADLSVYAVPPAPPLPDPPARRAGEKVRIYMGGDSAMYTIAMGVADWADEDGRAAVWNAGRFGCGVGRGGLLRFEGEVRPTDPELCDGFDWYGQIKKVRPHLAVLLSGTWDVVDRQLPGDDSWRSFGDPLYDQFIRRELTATIDALESQGATVVLMTHPIIRSGVAKQLAGPFAENDPERMHRFNELLVEVAATRPRTVVVDLEGHLAARPNGELDLKERPDGIHFSKDASAELAQWLGPQLVAIADGRPTDPGVVIADNR